MANILIYSWYKNSTCVFEYQIFLLKIFEYLNFRPTLWYLAEIGFVSRWIHNVASRPGIAAALTFTEKGFELPSFSTVPPSVFSSIPPLSSYIFLPVFSYLVWMSPYSVVECHQPLSTLLLNSPWCLLQRIFEKAH